MPNKFKPTRERKRRNLQRQQNPNDDTNTEVIASSKSEQEIRRQALRDQLRAQQSQPKISAKKAKRLDKYIENKLKKDEAADLVRKLEKEREKFDAAAAGLQSSKQLKRKFNDYVSGQVNGGVTVEETEQATIRPPGKQRAKLVQDPKKSQQDSDVESVDSFEEDHEAAFDPAQAPVVAKISADDEWLKQRAAPTQGTGLAQPLLLGANGLPVIPMRGNKRRREQQAGTTSEGNMIEQVKRAETQKSGSEDSVDEDSWDGFSDASVDEMSDSDEDPDIAEKLKDIDPGLLDQLIDQLERSDSESDLSDEDSEAEDTDDDEEDNASQLSEQSGSSQSDNDSETSDTSQASKEDVRIKPRASAFKSWATQQLNQSMGHTPFYDQPQSSQPTSQPQTFEKPAAGYKLGIKELDGPKPDRRVYTVPVNRTPEIQESRSHLPILQREQEIMEAVHNNSVIVIKGDTGSGKTTQVPQFLFEAGFGDHNGPTAGIIGVTQPRRVAAVSMAKRVAEELGDHGDKVAHQIRFDTTVSNKTAVKFMTDGILLRELSQDLLLRKYSVIVIDEAHERSVNTDLLIGLLSKIVPARAKKMPQNPNPQPLKLIIMSATLNINDFLHEKLFSGSLRPPIVEAEGRQHRVTVHFALKSRADYLEETIQKVKRAHRKLPRGGILIFLTGQNEIKYVLSELRKQLVRSDRVSADPTPRLHITPAETPLEAEDMDFGNIDRTDKVIDRDDDIDILVDEEEADKEFEISDDEDEAQEDIASTQNGQLSNRDPYDTVHLLPLYSQLPTKEQMRIFEPPPNRSRMIVIATNVAETSLTIPGIRYVFDCGRSKEKKFDTETNVQSFEIDYISKASAQQRAGRAGRTGPGHCWRLYSSAVFEQFFPDHTEPEILRTPAESVVLQLKGIRYPKPVVDFPFPSAPGREMLSKAEILLRNLGAIEGPHGTLTDIGQKLSLYPLSPRLGKIVVNAVTQPKVLHEILMLVAALSVDDIFVNQTQMLSEDQDNDDLKQSFGRVHASFSKYDKTSDALKMLVAVQMYLASSDKSDFCQQYFLRPKAMGEIAQLCGQLRAMVIANLPTLKDIQPATKLSSSSVSNINKITASGYIDQIAIRYDAHPTPPVLPAQPRRAIDVPYLPLQPLKTASHSTDIVDRAVFLHPTSILVRSSAKSLPPYIVYRHLQTSQPSTANPSVRPKTRMFPLCALDEAGVLGLIRETGLIEYGKPVPKTKVEEIPNTRPKERVCWVSTAVKNLVQGNAAWPLPPTRVRQVVDMKSPSGWSVLQVLA